jgi:hypothetical protein
MWGNEIIVEEPTPKPKRKKKTTTTTDWAAIWKNNDMDAWFRDNKPESSGECADLWQAMKKKQTVGNYSAGNYTTKTTGRKFLVVDGPVSQFIIVSSKVKRYFNKRLSRREEYFKILAAQFETGQDYNGRQTLIAKA